MSKPDFYAIRLKRTGVIQGGLVKSEATAKAKEASGLFEAAPLYMTPQLETPPMTDKTPAEHVETLRAVKAVYLKNWPDNAAVPALTYAIERLSAPEPVAVGREEIAREIDPDAWSEFDAAVYRQMLYSNKSEDEARADAAEHSDDLLPSLTKATAILAKLPSAALADRGAGEGE